MADFPPRRGSRLLRNLDTEQVPMLFEQVACFPAPAGGEVCLVANDHDLAVRVGTEIPRRQVRVPVSACRVSRWVYPRVYPSGRSHSAYKRRGNIEWKPLGLSQSQR
jgi:hypothetical protein